MSNTHSILKAAVSGLMLVGAGTSAIALAEKPGMEQCAGVIRGGQNDCATSTNACHGHVQEDANEEAWIYVPKGTCDKIAGATVVVVRDPTPASTTTTKG